jgi:GNAT superfamily N-acetyltransferase
MDMQALINQYQQHLVAALLARIAATEAAVGNMFGFEMLRHGDATLVMAHHWPRRPDQIPFDRVYAYAAPAAATRDPILERVASAQVDAIVEVLDDAQHTATEARLHQEQFTPRWEIPWFHLRLDQWTAPPSALVFVRKIEPHETARFATLLIQGYGYHGMEATFWHTFARYGYTAPGFHCFVAEVNDVPIAGGVLHIHDTIALVDGAATVPQYRGLGAQKALLTARMHYAREHGCTYAVSRTGAGSISHQNMEKLGLSIVARSRAWRRAIVSPGT